MHGLVIRGGTVVDGTGAPRYTADVAIERGRITAVGGRLGPAARDIDAEGLLVTPGFVDAHTHYDGQVLWDEEVAPSSGHGVTTVVMGNCGVGFAPVRPDQHDFLVQVMEGVEEIPGSALDAGLDWDWETFPQYLDALDRRRWTLDVATQVPHAALRCYVMGEDRANDVDARPDDVAQMRALTEEALRAGALGFSTSRTILHRTKKNEVVPGTHCAATELEGIAAALRDAGHGVFQMISDNMGLEPDLGWMKRIARLTGRPLIYTLAELPHDPLAYRRALSELDRAADEGLELRAAVPWRPPGVLLGVQASLHPFSKHPSFPHALARAERLDALRDASLRARLLAEEPTNAGAFLRSILFDFDQLFLLGVPPDYEPPPETSIAARARAAGMRPDVFAYDLLAAGGADTFLYRPLTGYARGDFSALHEMLCHPRAIASLSDGGAHVGSLCDASVTTYMLTHWAGDRRRGPRLPLEMVIRKQTSETAELYGLHDRGRIEVGRRADLNLIDLDGLRLHAPEVAYDLPNGGRRLLQRADGYHSTLVAGEVVSERGELTGARPGRLVRGPKP